MRMLRKDTHALLHDWLMTYVNREKLTFYVTLRKQIRYVTTTEFDRILHHVTSPYVVLRYVTLRYVLSLNQPCTICAVQVSGNKRHAADKTQTATANCEQIVARQKTASSKSQRHAAGDRKLFCLCG